MKKIITLVMLVSMMCVTSLAQNPAFMGIPIDGNINDFYRQLEAKGFSQVADDPNGNIFTGRFTDENVTLTIMPGVDNKVAMVGVYLPVKDTWSEVLADFGKYEKMYTAKYGDVDIETIEYAGTIPGSRACHDALAEGTAEYNKIFIEGDIFISLSIHEAVTDEPQDGFQFLILYINDNNYQDEEEDYSDQI